MPLSSLGTAIDRASPLPMYYQLKEILVKLIKDQPLPPESAIPSEMELIESYGVSRTTVRQAISELIKEGVLYTIKGKGTFVARPKIDLQYMNRAESFAEQIRSSGFVPLTTVVSLDECGPDDLATQPLELGNGETALRLVRLRYADDEPIVTAVSYHPLPLCAALRRHDLGKNSLYAVLALNEETRVHRIRRTIEAVGADKDIAKALRIKKGFPVQHFHTVACNRHGKPVEYCVSDYRGDRNKFSVEIMATK